MDADGHRCEAPTRLSMNLAKESLTQSRQDAKKRESNLFASWRLCVSPPSPFLWFMIPMRALWAWRLSVNRSLVGQTFLSAGSGDFPVARWNTGLESPVNRQAGKPALYRGSKPVCTILDSRKLSRPSLPCYARQEACLWVPRATLICVHPCPSVVFE